MANKKFLLGMLAVVLTFGILVVNCDTGNNPVLETDKTVNIAYLRATFPVLNFALSVFDINQNPTYVNIERKNTFNYDSLPLHVAKIPGTAVSGSAFWNSEVQAASDFISALYTADNETKFNLYVCDFDLAFAVYFFAINGIPESSYKITCYMDGSGSYTIPKARYAGDDGSQKLSDDCDAVSNVFARAKAGETWTEGIQVGDGRTGAQLIYYTLAMVKTFDNILWVVDNAATLVNSLPKISGEVEKLIAQKKIVQKNISGMVQHVKSTGKTAELEYLLKLRWGDTPDDCIASLFDQGNNKKTLMILGTNTSNEEAGNGVWGMIGSVNQLGYTLIGDDGFLSKVIARYGDRYNVFYKGHPATPTSGAKAAWFAERGITDILATIPAETMMYLYEDVYIGGYPGSTFQSAMDGQCVVSFGTPQWFDTNAPSANLDYFTNTEYMYKSGDNLVVEKRNEHP